MSRAKKVFLALDIIVVILIVLFSVPVGPKNVLFRSVTEQDRMDNDVVFTSELAESPRGQYVIHDGKLYLNTQETQGTLLITTYVSRPEWTTEEIQEFRKAHPELEPYWPDADAPNGGVKWVKEKR